MTEAQKDTLRAVAAAKAIFDGRNLTDSNFSSIMVTLEHTVASVLLSLFPDDPAKAAAMLNEGLVQGVESRISLYRSKQ